MSKQHILVIEDESSIADNIGYALQSQGFDFTWASLGGQGLDILQTRRIDLVILDIGLPDINGFEVCKLIRHQSTVPIIFLTARSEEIDKVVALEIGGDDYVVKPFSPRELVARVKAILRRQQQPQAALGKGSLFTQDQPKRKISYCDELLDLTTYEYGILSLMINHPERVYSRAQLMNAVWSDPEHSFERAVDTHIKTLRAKLALINPDNHVLITHRGMGYSLKLHRES
jgi:two-component system catabolic regulation response regulator CreB